jgi:FkbM family methyltransferase
MIKKLYRDIKILGFKRFTKNVIHELKLHKRRFENSFSQNGEDLIINKLLPNKIGFYVDVGANDPTRFSNTKRFHLKGWTGINIEPDPVAIKKFNTERPNDINLNIGISDKNSNLNFYQFEPSTLSTFSEKMYRVYIKEGFKHLKTIKVPIYKLEEILKKYRPKGAIDFFSIDTEGLDYEVLKSNNWDKFKPKVICIEKNAKAEKFLLAIGYVKVTQTPTNSIFTLKVIGR